MAAAATVRPRIVTAAAAAFGRVAERRPEPAVRRGAGAAGVAPDEVQIRVRVAGGRWRQAEGGPNRFYWEKGTLLLSARVFRFVV